MTNVINLAGENIDEKAAEVCASVVEYLHHLLAHAESGKLQYLAVVAGDDSFYLSEFRGETSRTALIGQVELLKLQIMNAREIP